MSSIKDAKLAHEGNQEVDWAARQMKVLEDIKTEFSQNKPLDGLNIGACMHVTKETANLMLTLNYFLMNCTAVKLQILINVLILIPEL